MEVKRFDIMSVAKIMAVLYAAIGVLLGALFTFISVIGLAVAGGAGMGIGGLVFGIGAIIIFPVFYGVMGFVFGALWAFVYNFIASRIGGIKFE